MINDGAFKNDDIHFGMSGNDHHSENHTDLSQNDLRIIGKIISNLFDPQQAFQRAEIGGKEP